MTAKGGVSTLSQTPPRRGNNRAVLPFVNKLVLNQWLLSLFRVHHFEQLAEHLRDENLEGIDGNNIHQFYHVLVSQFFDLPLLPRELLLEYDQNIVRHTQRLNERRILVGDEPIVWKYFQYLMLLFTEIYLDRYFRNPEALLASINEQIGSFNENKNEFDRVPLFELEEEAWPQLNKIAYWSATGSGKTLLMHANILQYQFYLEKYGRMRDLNRIILLTPNEGLSRQHLSEFQAAGIDAELFNKDGRGLFAGRAVEILDIHKLKDEMGDKTVAVDAFESNNLVLIDEGHRGASSGETGTWMRFRNALCEKGFSFEYSATFGQAVKGNSPLINVYARNILFDYSYHYFYRDGFGKDYQILNLDEDTQKKHLDIYLVGCLLSFFQQQRLYKEHLSEFQPFNIEKPLWIFVGSSVTKTLATKEASDIIAILEFLSRFVSHRADSIRHIEHILNQGLITAGGKDLFAGRFSHLNTLGLSSRQIFDDVLTTLFNATGGGALYLENLKGATGEIALRIGENSPFGVINVGDDAKLLKLCENRGLNIGEREFLGSLFHELGKPESTVNILIGSKKFTEGWNSWRVSTMGLMNVGATEGAQIIQLFGRGVRLKGFDFSLKRSLKSQLPEGMKRPKNISILETLNVFGINSKYMTQFRTFLQEEGLPDNEEKVEILLPVIVNLGRQNLKTIQLKKTIEGINTDGGNVFGKLGPIPTLTVPNTNYDPALNYLQKNQVILNWYPKIQTMKSSGINIEDEEAIPNQTHLSDKHIAFLDIDALFFELERFKAERGWFNLNITQKEIPLLLVDHSWYRLLIPAVDLEFNSFEKVDLWQEIALALLKKYVERYYSFRKREWELPHLEYQDLTDEDPNLLVHEGRAGGYYQILIESSKEEIISKITELKHLIETGNLQPWEFRGIKAIWFSHHLYQPLLYLDKKIIEISPIPLNSGERDLVEDLKSFYEREGKFFEGKELYLLRNLSRGRGIGFFEAGNFHPDFILWLISGSCQYIAFIDPKGIRNLAPTDPKIQFYNTIKEIQDRMEDPNVILESFIISNTPSNIMKKLWSLDKEAIQSMHILFQIEDRSSYIGTMLSETIN